MTQLEYEVLVSAKQDTIFENDVLQAGAVKTCKLSCSLIWTEIEVSSRAEAIEYAQQHAEDAIDVLKEALTAEYPDLLLRQLRAFEPESLNVVLSKAKSPERVRNPILVVPKSMNLSAYDPPAVVFASWD